ncbi:murein transglycosylase [Actinophytocola xanthii]|uniref:Murein transglycosylase n=1 Tax=Actinophytocola xanthii TaxID=1912961 RepID=A0A1Q8CLS8_9PSEU|nr:murein transglycosylase [Actinophytocola xanthii]
MEPSSPPRGPHRRRVVGPLFIVIVLVAGLVGVVVLDRSEESARRPPADPAFEVPQQQVLPRSAVPQAAAIAPGGDRTTVRPTTAAVRDWATTVSEKTQIPSRTLVAYAEAELAVRASAPECGLSWTTLAGVGRVESHHGRYGGTTIGDDGRLSPPIVGIPLDGSEGVKAIPDTDDGRLDGDVEWDRAVGAMQFLPTTWSRWGARANGDGEAPDPQNIDDAALSAAKYLCASGGDLSSADGWWRAVLTYNRSVAYGQDVFSGADAYAKAARELG